MPTKVIGNSFLNSTSLIAFCGASVVFTNSLIPSSIEVIPSFNTTKGARGLERITTYALLCMIAMLLNAVVALRIGRPEKARLLLAR